MFIYNCKLEKIFGVFEYAYLNFYGVRAMI